MLKRYLLDSRIRLTINIVLAQFITWFCITHLTTNPLNTFYICIYSIPIVCVPGMYIATLQKILPKKNVHHYTTSLLDLIYILLIVCASILLCALWKILIKKQLHDQSTLIVFFNFTWPIIPLFCLILLLGLGSLFDGTYDNSE